MGKIVKIVKIVKIEKACALERVGASSSARSTYALFPLFHETRPAPVVFQMLLLCAHVKRLKNAIPKKRDAVKATGTRRYIAEMYVAGQVRLTIKLGEIQRYGAAKSNAQNGGMARNREFATR